MLARPQSIIVLSRSIALVIGINGCMSLRLRMSLFGEAVCSSDNLFLIAIWKNDEVDCLPIRQYFILSNHI